MTNTAPPQIALSHSICKIRKYTWFWKQSAQLNHWWWGKYAPKDGFSAFVQSVWIFLRKKLKNSIRYPISHRNGYINFCRPTSLSPKNSRAQKKLFFAVILKSIIVFFLKKLLNEEYSKPHFLQKRLYLNMFFFRKVHFSYKTRFFPAGHIFCSYFFSFWRRFGKGGELFLVCGFIRRKF